MRILLLEDHTSPVATVMMTYLAGAVDEEPGKSGVAHVLEHMMFKGTKTRKTGDFSRIIANHGGIENASTAY
ncbi:MAG: insulinase family protein, partial [Sinomicrobium sp.]|nr:insulinase family protein [Sinomicrobium sp.]